MRYLRFLHPVLNKACLGQLEGSSVSVLRGSLFAGPVRTTGETMPLDAISTYLPPVEPPDIIAIGRNYADHCKESGADLPDLPLVFLKATSALAAHRDPILLPEHHPDEVDFEAELAVIIGSDTFGVSEENAMAHVFGITCANDISARDVQNRVDRQWARAKSFDTFCPLGPWIDTHLDRLEDRKVALFLNGEKMQDQPVSDMLFSIPRVIAHLSAGMTLRTGTVLLTGTPSGVGMGRNPPRFLREGDRMEVSIDGIGRLCNSVKRRTSG